MMAVWLDKVYRRMNGKKKMKISKTVLLVEDDADDQEFFLDALSGIENSSIYDVVENGQEALETMKSHRTYPDIIFMDVNMPMMNGIECLTEIIKNPLTRSIPVVILSTNSNQMELAAQIGARVFLTKPIDPDELRKQIEATINIDFNHSTPLMQTYPSMLHAS